MTIAKKLSGLPPYGPLAIGFPQEWGKRGHEGLVVGFSATGHDDWVGNFAPGLGKINEVLIHPNERDIIVIAMGTAWIVNPLFCTATEMDSLVSGVWTVLEPSGFIFECEGLAFFRLCAKGVMWHTRRISWDGLRNVRVETHAIIGEAYSPYEPNWVLFRVDLHTGRAEGGNFENTDTEKWEHLST